MKDPVLFKPSDARMAGSITLQNGWDAAVELGMLAEAYQAAANAVVSELSGDKHFTRSISTASSFQAFPAIFLYRQALELALKGVITAGAPMLDSSDTDALLQSVYGSHSFEKLRPLVEEIFAAIGWEFDFGIASFRSKQAFRKLLAEFDRFDPTSTACRYPVDSCGNPTMPAPLCINLYDFAAALDSILTLLRDAPSIIKDEVQRYLESLYEEQEAAWSSGL